MRGAKVLMILAAAAVGLGAAPAMAQGAYPAGERPALGMERLTQEQIGELSLIRLRREGRRIFSTPFNKLDGLGGSPDLLLTLQDNGLFLRVNGMDSQTCHECHDVLSNASVPARFGVGGFGGAAENALAGPTEIDVADDHGVGFASFNGRFINPPFVFGAGGGTARGRR